MVESCSAHTLNLHFRDRGTCLEHEADGMVVLGIFTNGEKRDAVSAVDWANVLWRRKEETSWVDGPYREPSYRMHSIYIYTHTLTGEKSA